MSVFFIISNIALTAIVGIGIYSFSGNIFWAVIGASIITGSASANPIFALIAYPAIEYFFNNGNLTIFSAFTVGITIIQMIVVMVQVKESRKFHE